MKKPKGAAVPATEAFEAAGVRLGFARNLMTLSRNMDAQPRFYDARLDTVILRVRLTPNAARMGIGGVFTDADGRAWLRASVTVVPEKGRANAALIEMLAKKLKIRKSAFTILSGETDRHKTLRIEGIDPDSCAALI